MRHDTYSDTWVATDALGRELPGYEQVGPPKPGRHVGIFYFICNVYDGPEPPRDVTKLLAANPQQPGFEPGVAHFWGEPELGYYRSTDRWVIRKHAYMLADAGIDTLIFDVTNDVTFPETYTAVCDVFRQVRGEGEATPDVCFLASRRSIKLLWEEFYSKGLYADLWFKWQGKPLLLFGQHDKRGFMADVRLPAHIREFFTIRQSWAWDSLPWYGEDGHHRWPWVAHYPQRVGWDQPGVAEQVAVAVGQHPLSGIGRSFHDGQQPQTNEYDVTPYTHLGLHFEEQWRRGLEVDPEFVFVTGWNEWMAGGMVCDDTSYEALQGHWDFFPGARLGRASKPLNLGDIYFIDQYNQEFSRDAEPMKGGHTDNYYYQLIANVRRYKGVRAPQPTSPPLTIHLDGGFDQWAAVQPEYRDHFYDTEHRNEPGWGSAGPYVNRSGRNEFVSLKAARDGENVYFYAQTRGPVSPAGNANWMMLFINADRRKDTGWEGYDYAINLPVLDGSRTTVKRNTGGWSWETVGEARYRVEGDRLMIAVPRALLGMAGGPVEFDFHWADNVPLPARREQRADDVDCFFVDGDHAPARRFDYRYPG
jgi:hypothetical protein